MANKDQITYKRTLWKMFREFQKYDMTFKLEDNTFEWRQATVYMKQIPVNSEGKSLNLLEVINFLKNW